MNRDDIVMRKNDFIIEAQSQINTWASISGPSVLSSDFAHASHSHVNLDASSTNAPAEEEVAGARIFPKAQTDSLYDYEEFKYEMNALFAVLNIFVRRLIAQATILVSNVNKKFQKFLIVSEREATLALSPAIETIRAIQIQKRNTTRVPIEVVPSCQAVAIIIQSKKHEPAIKTLEEVINTPTRKQHKSENMSIFRLVISMVYRELIYGKKRACIDNA